jgi:hypothetical protein
VTQASIDLNADLGEGFGVWRLGDDDALLELVTSANVACGFHAGDPSTMRRVCTRAAADGVAIGAQVSYRDLAGFGRRFIDVDPAELADDVLYQLAALDGIARSCGSRVTYVKPHGALYNAAVAHEAQAQAVVDAVVAFGGTLPVLGLPGSALLRAAGGTPRRARWCPARNPVRWSRTPNRSRPARSPWPATASSWPSTDRASRSRSSRSASTATPRERSGSRGPSGRRWRRPG